MAKNVKTTKIEKLGSKHNTTQTVTPAAKSAVLFSAKEMKAVDNATADRMISQITATGTRLRKMAHVAACGILLHWQEHGDWTKLVPLADAIGLSMSKRMRTAFLEEWVPAFTSLRYSKDSGKFTNNGKERLFNLVGNPEAPEDTVQHKGCLNIPFYDAGFGDRPAYSFNFEEALQALLDKAERAMERKLEAKTKTEQKRIAIEAKDVARLETFAASFGVKPKSKEEKTDKKAA